MSSQICVICYNKNIVNQTDNRLVTESCGHVKCMNCLLHEKSGCLACLRNGSESEVNLQQPEPEPNQTIELIRPIDDGTRENGTQLENLTIKKKYDYTHIKTEIEGGKKSYYCTICKKKFYSRSQVCYHAYCAGDKKPFNCQICKQSFITLSHYKYHMRNHNKDKTYVCDVCNATFYHESKLKRHKLKHTKEKNYLCNDCSKAFNNLTSLRKHILCHTEERPYTCPVCSKRFRDVSNFKKHVDKHKKRCNICGEVRVSETEGTKHRCTSGYKGPKLHSCPRCSMMFHSKKDMRRHSGTHTDSKPYRCKICPEERRFRRKDNLERHVRNSHPNCTISDALDCDVNTLESITHHAVPESDENFEQTEKIRLEILNPLPPLPQEVIQKHIDVPVISPKDITSDSVVDKKSIIEANNARESVIVEKKVMEKVPSPENEYVHKIRKAIIPLPPIDQEKFRSVQRGILPKSDCAPPIKNMEIYKKILYEKIEKDTTEVIQNPKMHWRRKMEQDIN